LISGVWQSLAGLGRLAASAPEEAARVPAVPIRRSVQRDYVVCLECGFRGKQLRRHLTARHGLDADAYRARWKLAADHPLVAPGYSEQRSALADPRPWQAPAMRARQRQRARTDRRVERLNLNRRLLPPQHRQLYSISLGAAVGGGKSRNRRGKSAVGIRAGPPPAPAAFSHLLYI
jgi:predicted transcriptional regulator